MSVDRILKCEDKESAYAFSKAIYDEEYARLNKPVPRIDTVTTYKFSIHENILSGQFGLSVRHEYWDALPDQFKVGVQIQTPLWVNAEFINGPSFFALGVGPLGFGMVDPARNRKILEGNYSPELISQVRSSTRQYSLQVHTAAQGAIDAILRNPDAQRQTLAQIGPFAFEELIAELLNDNGFDVFLTSRTRDGGKDIYAAFPSAGGHILMLVECKRRPPESAIDVVEARALLGQYYYENRIGNTVDCAMLVTTAGKVGPTVLAFEERLAEFKVKNIDDILGWINRYGQMRNGLWTPSEFNQVL